MSYQVISMQNRGLVPNHEASAVKIYAAELNQRIQNTALKIFGLYGQLDRGDEGQRDRALRHQQGPLRPDVPAGRGLDHRRRHQRDQPQHHRDARPRLAAGLVAAVV